MSEYGLFLDRDGVINRDFGYVYKIEDFKIIPGVLKALKGFLKLNYKIFIITNQSGIQRGYYSLKDFEILTKHMLEIFKKNNIFITKVYYCKHLSGCENRKPNPGMILRAKKEFNIDLKNSILVGDKQSDIQAGINAGISRNFLVDENTTLFDIYKLIKKDKR